jgi:hypothetical protein
MAKKRCLFCPRWFEPYAPLATRQLVCRRAGCRYKLKLLLNRAWKGRRNAQWRKDVNRRLRAWAKEYPYYWQCYRKKHLAYVARDNARRARRSRRQRWGCSAKDEY